MWPANALGRRRGLLLAGGVLALAGVLIFARLGMRSLWTMEVRWAEIPREMLQSGNFFRPTINGKLYYDKPVGSYWLVLAASSLTGKVDELSARLPSALAGLLAVALCMRLAQRLCGGRVAVLAGLILATSFSFVEFARTASADIENVAGELAALVLFVECRRWPAGWWLVPFWLVMALTSLTKGLLGFALPLLIVGTFSTLMSAPQIEHGSWFGRVLIGRNRWVFNWKTPLAFVIAAGVYFLPFSFSRAGDHGLALVFRENLQRFFAPANHRGPFYLYAGTIFVMMAPWSALLPAAVVRGLRRGVRADEGRQFALVYFVVTFAFFTLSVSRRSYYLLPILPAGALLVAQLLASPAEALAPFVRKLMQLGFGVVALLGVAAGFALAPHKTWLPHPLSSLPDLPAPWLFAAGWIVVLAAIGFALLALEPRRIVVACGTMAALSLAYVFMVALPAAEAFRGEKAFARQVRHTVGDASGLALYRTRELVYYLELPQQVNDYESEDALHDAIRQGRIRWLIVRERDLTRLPTGYSRASVSNGFFWEGYSRKTPALLLQFGAGPQALRNPSDKGE